MVDFGMSGILKNILFKQLISFSKCVAFLYQKRFSYYLNLIYMKKQYALLLGLLVFSLGVIAQNAGPIYDVLVKGGHVIDAKNGIDGIMDIAIKQGKIFKVDKNLNAKDAKQVVDAAGLIVAPGLIDLHAHVFAGTQPDHYLSDGLSALMPDGYTFRVGVTTVVDCGGAGWKNFATFKKNVIDASQTRVLSFLNIVGEGMRGGNYEQDLAEMNSKFAASAAKQYSDYIVGFKLAHFNGEDWTPTDRVVEAGNLAGLPVIIDFGGSKPNLPIQDLFFKHLRPGDIYTHTYAALGGAREEIVDEKNNLKPFVLEAQKRGIVFDVGYGGASFNYSQAIPALKAGLYPNTISTDLHTGSMNTSMKDQLSVMSKFLNMGMSLVEVIKASTWKPAQVINRPLLGNLSEGSEADIAIFNVRKGNFGFYDKTGFKLKGTEKLECEVTIKGGKVLFDLNGLANPIYVK
jgi:dihydroorotase